MNLIITCQVLREMGLKLGCCDSCHEDAGLGYYDGQMCQSDPYESRKFGSIVSDVCCTNRDVFKNWNRDDWARAARVRRRMDREETIGRFGS